MLLHPQKKNHKRLREVLNQQYAHLDSTASSGDKHEVGYAPPTHTHSPTLPTVSVIHPVRLQGSVPIPGQSPRYTGQSPLTICPVLCVCRSLSPFLASPTGTLSSPH